MKSQQHALAHAEFHITEALRFLRVFNGIMLEESEEDHMIADHDAVESTIRAENAVDLALGQLQTTRKVVQIFGKMPEHKSQVDYFTNVAELSGQRAAEIQAEEQTKARNDLISQIFGAIQDDTLSEFISKRIKAQHQEPVAPAQSDPGDECECAEDAIDAAVERLMKEAIDKASSETPAEFVLEELPVDVQNFIKKLQANGAKIIGVTTRKL